jgi:4-amino-4-deoxy-L-arabinose transferase-like glycosyltransferase
MKKTTFINQPYHWLLLLLIIGLFFLKLEALSLPFFWDEAWSYLPAIRVMAEQGPSIIPGSIDTELYRGHPMMFYFLSSLWIKTFGYSLPIAHLFSLFVSIILLVSVYFITYNWTNSYFAGFLATLLLFIQPIFLAQSTFLLSEVMLGLFFVWTFYFYFKKQWIGFGIAMVAALLTKESAYCLVPAFVITSGVEWYFNRINTKTFFKNMLIISLFFLIGFSFFIFQKIKFGWFFFPLHTSMIDFEAFGSKMEGSFLVLFLAQGRNIVFLITFIIAIVSVFFLKNKLSLEKQIILVSILIFTVGFMFFAAINFFSARYLFGCIPLLMIGCTLVLYNFNKKYYASIIITFFVVLGAINIYRSIENKTINDVELSYTKLLNVQVQMVDYLEKSDFKEQIYTPFLMFYNLNTTYAGFINSKKFQLTQNVLDTNNVYFINVSNEKLNEIDSLLINKKVILLKKFEEKQAFIELYKKNENFN